MFAGSQNSITFASAFVKESKRYLNRCMRDAAIAQLVEHDLAKVGVASSSLVCRSHGNAQVAEW